MKHKRVSKIISLISSLSLVFQSFLPLAIAMPVYANDESVIASDSAAIPDIEVDPSSEPTPETTPAEEQPQEAVRYNSIFYLLPKLEMGDIITLYFEGERFDYHVVEKKLLIRMRFLISQTKPKNRHSLL